MQPSLCVASLSEIQIWGTNVAELLKKPIYKDDSWRNTHTKNIQVFPNTHCHKPEMALDWKATSTLLEPSWHSDSFWNCLYLSL